MYQEGDFRLEGFFEGRPISVWEMRNPTIMMTFCDKIFDYNFNTAIRSACEKIKPIDKNDLYIDMAINKWAPEVKESLPSFRGRLLQDNGIPHPHTLKCIDAFDKLFLF